MKIMNRYKGGYQIIDISSIDILYDGTTDFSSVEKEFLFIENYFKHGITKPKPILLCCKINGLISVGFAIIELANRLNTTHYISLLSSGFTLRMDITFANNKLDEIAFSLNEI